MPLSSSAQGFGPPKEPKAPKNPKRVKAAKRYEAMQAKGLPEFNIFIRHVDRPKNWLPVGSLSVERSAVINAAIFQNEDQLLKGAKRLFPKLVKQSESLEYGYRLKDYPDEPITLAQRPSPNPVRNLVQKVQAIFKRTKD